MLKSMLTHLRETRMREFEGEEVAEAGFTLIELMVVLLIIAILLAIAIPTFLGVANSAGDRAAQSNLTNALTEAKALYQNAATYSPANTAMTTGTFSSSAPEFSWAQGTGTTGGCSASPSNCVSEQVVDAGALQDGQGIILATYSSKTQSCWYAVDLESTPIVLTGDSSATPPGVAFINGTTSVPTTTQTGGWTAGVFYAQKKSGVTASNCNANWAATQAHFGWGLSYASPGAAQ
jgi:prepilin-type N-terminal cleavage/methylation domain-containing protein